ncbi:hypothetical protein J6590_013393 [Homalodisca vitripennis]|nr:hypothetical protein J6590_013393 [Homalodisca vitripennis]
MLSNRCEIVHVEMRPLVAKALSLIKKVEEQTSSHGHSHGRRMSYGSGYSALLITDKMATFWSCSSNCGGLSRCNVFPALPTTLFHHRDTTQILLSPLFFLSIPPLLFTVIWCYGDEDESPIKRNKLLTPTCQPVSGIFTPAISQPATAICNLAVIAATANCIAS